MLVKAQKTCPHCQTKYILMWDNEKYDMQPLSCPFCNHEIDEESSESNDDNWD